jgi:hypothetical protein
VIKAAKTKLSGMILKDVEVQILQKKKSYISATADKWESQTPFTGTKKNLKEFRWTIRAL